LVSFLLSLPFL